MANTSEETTVTEAIAALRARGYTDDFAVSEDGRLRCVKCGHTHAPEDAVVEVTYRFEGESDPDDEAVVFGLSCPSCDKRGVLVAAYGPSATPEEAAVVTALR